MNYRQDIAFPGYKRFPLPTSVFRLPFLFLAGVNAELEEEDRRSLVDEFVIQLYYVFNRELVNQTQPDTH